MALAIDGINQFQNYGSGGTPLTVSLTTTNATDFLGLVIAANGISASTVTVTDATGHTGNGGTWQQKIAAVNGAFADGMVFFWNTSSAILSSATITASFAGGTPSFASLMAFGVSGANLSSPFDPLGACSCPTADGTVGGAGLGYFGANGHNPSNNADPLTVTTTLANTMLIAMFSEISNSSSTAGAGFTLGISTINQDFAMWQYQLLSAAGSNSITQGDANDSKYSGVVAIAAAPPSGIAVWPYRM
jgi:hypothetical protein